MASRRAKSSQKGAPQPNPRVREAAADIYRVVRRVSLDDITVVDEVQVRDGLDEEHVERLADLLLGGGAYKDPIVLFEEDDGSRRILADGWHRREGYQRALERFAPSEEVPELKPLLAEIRPGGLDGAIEYAEEANLTHGKQLSMQDKRNVVFRRWGRGHDWLQLSNRALGAILGVSRMTIANWRREFEEMTGNNLPVEGTKRIGADGRVYDAGNIQVANQLRAAREALAKIKLPEILPGSEGEAALDELRRWLLTSIRDLKLMLGSAGRLRPYLPYALQMELEADEPRVSLVNWLRGELPNWKVEQAGISFEAQIAALRVGILESLEGGPMRSIELMASLGDPPPAAYRAAREQLKDEGLIIEEVGPGMRVSFRLGEAAGDWLGQPEVKGAPPGMAAAANGSPAHSDDHDPALDEAYRASAVLGQAVVRADEAIRKLLAVRGIRALYALPEDKMKQVYGDLTELHYLARDLATYCDTQLEKLRVMARTGRPYDDEEGQV